ncbi:DNA/RNA non-specific endonuclease [Neorhizobium galegae bv. orientalis]|nr:DNA/RNA non-specific endonuclease [Neorhizobium galegae bv. orientalis]
MVTGRENKVRDYLNLVASRMGGVEAILTHYEEELRAPTGGIESTEDALRRNARGGLENMAMGGAPRPEEISGIEAIILPDLRPVIDISDGTFESTHRLWTKLSTDAAIRSRIEAALPSIGRIELPGFGAIPYGGTGFVVGDGLLMTNRHVAEIFALGLGDQQLSFIPGRKAGVDFLRERDNTPGHIFRISKVRMIHPYWDMAILEVEGLHGAHRPLPLSLADARELAGTEVVMIGYPAFDSRNPADVQDELFSGRYGVKRLQPGLLQGGFNTDSFGKIVPAATHDCTGLGGSSGSGAADIQTGEIVALHFAGRYLERNYAVPTAALAQDQRVVDAGVVFAGTPPGGPNDWGAWWQRADRRESVSAAATSNASSPPGASGPRSPVVASTSNGSVTFEVPLRVTLSLGGPVEAPMVVSVEAPTELEAPGSLVVPRSTADYAGRTGYNPDFLAGNTELPPVTVPIPNATDPSVLAPTKDGGDTLHYQNFSIKMHANRRLALVTASNVTEEPGLREPEPGRNYSRKGLFSERWFPDLRLDTRYQLPDVFFSEDQGAFDKGHIVRRDDVAWGETFEKLLKGNVDSFHGTNCSPQVAGFNRSDSGRDNWGDLENHVLSQAASERLCVFAGPVLGETDRIFFGRGANGATIRAQIPQSFWKVIVARVSDGLAAYGFLLDQVLTDVPLEFSVAEEFVTSMRRLVEIEGLTGVSFHQSTRNADQYDTVRGIEVAFRSTVGRGSTR